MKKKKNKKTLIFWGAVLLFFSNLLWFPACTPEDDSDDTFDSTEIVPMYGVPQGSYIPPGDSIP